MATYRLTVATSAQADTIEGESTPAASEDGRSRVVWSCDAFGRGVSVTVQPLTADTQFVLHAIRVTVTPSYAGADDA